jgi:hypothetical protein
MATSKIELVLSGEVHDYSVVYRQQTIDIFGTDITIFQLAPRAFRDFEFLMFASECTKFMNMTVEINLIVANYTRRSVDTKHYRRKTE